MAEVAELADAPDSKSGSRKRVWVQVPPSAFPAHHFPALHVICSDIPKSVLPRLMGTTFARNRLAADRSQPQIGRVVPRVEIGLALARSASAG